eukprot:scaffold28024_cov90-Isochrysis_galbana.AAC.2
MSESTTFSGPSPSGLSSACWSNTTASKAGTRVPRESSSRISASEIPLVAARTPVNWNSNTSPTGTATNPGGAKGGSGGGGGYAEPGGSDGASTPGGGDGTVAPGGGGGEVKKPVSPYDSPREPSPEEHVAFPSQAGLDGIHGPADRVALLLLGGKEFVRAEERVRELQPDDDRVGRRGCARLKPFVGQHGVNQVGRPLAEGRLAARNRGSGNLDERAGAVAQHNLGQRNPVVRGSHAQEAADGREVELDCGKSTAGEVADARRKPGAGRRGWSGRRHHDVEDAVARLARLVEAGGWNVLGRLRQLHKAAVDVDVAKPPVGGVAPLVVVGGGEAVSLNVERGREREGELARAAGHDAVAQPLG